MRGVGRQLENRRQRDLPSPDVEEYQTPRDGDIRSVQSSSDNEIQHNMNPSRSLSNFVCSSCRRTDLPQAARKPFVVRYFQTSPRTPAPRDDLHIDNTFSPLIRQQNARSGQSTQGGKFGFLDAFNPNGPPPNEITKFPTMYTPKHRLHVYATKHNTHITLTAPVPIKDNGDTNPYRAPEPNKVILSLAAGNIGFRKAGRGSYDAAFQLTAFVTKQIKERGLLRDIERMEVVLRGFGAGREAVTKALLGVEGKNIRGKIKSVVDSTRLKFGGPRSPKPRRLG